MSRYGMPGLHAGLSLDSLQSRRGAENVPGSMRDRSCRSFDVAICLPCARASIGSLLTKGSPRHSGGGAVKVPRSLDVFLLDASGTVGPLPISSTSTREVFSPRVRAPGSAPGSAPASLPGRNSPTARPCPVKPSAEHKTTRLVLG